MAINLSLDRIKCLASYFDPYTRPTIHIAGTNGKGSVAALVSSILHASDPPLTVGRFNSPHLIEPRDTISVNGQAISQASYDTALSLVQSANEQHETDLSSFELLTLAALVEFERLKVDYVVLEVGLGGRLDATNVIPDSSVVVSALTAVDLDHQAFLGNTVEAIAAEKAAIARQGKPFVLGPQKHPEVLSVVEKAINKTGAVLVPSLTPKLREWEESVDEFRPPSAAFFRSLFAPTPVVVSAPPFSDPLKLLLPLHGAHQIDNLATALTIVLELLASQHDKSSQQLKRRVTPSTIRNGVAAVVWPGRLSFQEVSSLPYIQSLQSPLNVLVDGAHNPASAEALASFISSLIDEAARSGRFDKINLIYILGLSHSPPKTALQTLSPLLPPRAKGASIHINTCVAAVAFSPPAGMPWVKCTPLSEVQDAVASLAPDANLWKGSEGAPGERQLIDAFAWATTRCDPGNKVINLVVVAGSLYLVADFYRLIRNS